MLNTLCVSLYWIHCVFLYWIHCMFLYWIYCMHARGKIQDSTTSEWPDDQCLFKRKEKPLVFSTWLSLFPGNLGHFTRIRLRTVLPIPTNMCSISVCPNNGTAASVVVFCVHTTTDVNSCHKTWRGRGGGRGSNEEGRVAGESALTI